MIVENFGISRFATGIVSSPCATASAPPGQKSYCRSMRRRARMREAYSSPPSFVASATLHRELEALAGEPLVLAAVEAIQPRRAVAYALLDLVGLDEQIHCEDLFAEVAFVQIGAEDDLVQTLELREREARREQLESDRRVANLAPQPLVSARDDLAVIERELRQIVEAEPADAHRVGRGADAVIRQLRERVV